MISRTYLVTGAAGFIGAALAKRLIKQGNKVVTIDNLSTGFIESIPEGVIFIEGNCQDESIINQLFSYKFDAIFHIAGQSSGEISFEDPVYDLQTNTQSTLLFPRSISLHFLTLPLSTHTATPSFLVFFLRHFGSVSPLR